MPMPNFVTAARDWLNAFLNREDRTSDYERILGQLMEDQFKSHPGLVRDLLNQPVANVAVEELAVMRVALKLLKEQGETPPVGLEDQIQKRFDELKSKMSKDIAKEAADEKARAEVKKAEMEKRVQPALAAPLAPPPRKTTLEDEQPPSQPT